ncbi:MAG: acyl-CoA dehydrogenase [Chloroflexota bacterium]|nr:MAG: acyl-CoA dehydrogenase [Chloroflexota bacterium]
MKRPIFNDEHQMFRETVRAFIDKEVTPHHPQWEKEGMVSREVWRKAGEMGFLCFDAPEEYGGAGLQDFRYNSIVSEELWRAGATGIGWGLHSDIVLPYLMHYANAEQKKRWLPKLIAGEHILAIAMSEPAAGSDLAGIRTTAVRDGDHYIVNGSKTFITNGIMSDLVVTVVKTNPELKHKGISLLVLERGMEGFERGRKLDKIGLKAQDTAELFFDNVRVPRENLLGDEGKGFVYLMQQLPQERLHVAIGAMGSAEAAFEMTLKYIRERHAFGKPVGSFQNSRFKMAEMKTEIEIGFAFIDKCIMALNARELTTEEASMAKWWTTDLQKRVADECLQLFGGYGYMTEYPISKNYLDARVQSIYAGTNEIMKEVIGRGLGL